MTDRDVGEQLAALTARVHQGPAAGEATAPADEVVLGMLAPLHVREFAARMSELRERLDSEVPPVSPFGMINAATALELAITAIDVAARYTTPHLPIGQSGYVVQPPEAAALIERLGQAGEALGKLIEQVNRQLAALHLDSLRGRIEGPPSSTPHAEVERLIRELLFAGTAAASIGSSATLAVTRARRLRATGGRPVD